MTFATALETLEFDERWLDLEHYLQRIRDQLEFG